MDEAHWRPSCAPPRFLAMLVMIQDDLAQSAFATMFFSERSLSEGPREPRSCVAIQFQQRG